MARIDLNSDLGENSPGRIVSDDAAMLDIVTSANVSCGFHAGDPAGIRQTVVQAAERGVAVGAHPGYRDFENYGRVAMDIDPGTLQAEVEYQLGALAAFTASAGTQLRYVKPHGALYNTIARDEVQAKAVAAAIKATFPNLVFLGLCGGVSLKVAEAAGLAVAAEAFADRNYNADGTLVSRTRDDAVLHDPEAVAQRMLALVETGKLKTVDGPEITLNADSICVHGDSPDAIAMAAKVREVLTQAGVDIRPFATT